jgi:hypothetical protein
MKSDATTVAAYLKSLPADRRAEIEQVRDVVNRNLDRSGFEERMSYGMISWVVPHRVFPDGYHCDPKQPLPFAGLASQKQYCAVYVPLVVPADHATPTDPELSRWFASAWQRSGKKLDMGKCCIRFRRAADLPLDVLGELFRRLPAQHYVAAYVAARASSLARGPRSRARVRAGTAERAAARPAKVAPKPAARGERGGGRAATGRVARPGR